MRTADRVRCPKLPFQADLILLDEEKKKRGAGGLQRHGCDRHSDCGEAAWPDRISRRLHQETARGEVPAQ